MSELIHTHSIQVTSPDGTLYTVYAYGQQREDGTWSGWLEFHPANKSEPVLKTKQETSQPSREAVEYWATGLEPVYLDGALARAERS
jgi:hypothetical protein